MPDGKKSARAVLETIQVSNAELKPPVPETFRPTFWHLSWSSFLLQNMEGDGSQGLDMIAFTKITNYEFNAHRPVQGIQTIIFLLNQRLGLPSERVGMT